ncbi:MAG: hypothetical protein ABI747_04610 [Candidatus Moraniibacteriota bacterium]
MDGKSYEDRIAELDRKFGSGQGATKERRKLQAKIEARDQNFQPARDHPPEPMEKRNAARRQQGKESKRTHPSGRFIYNTPWGKLPKPEYP